MSRQRVVFSLPAAGQKGAYEAVLWLRLTEEYPFMHVAVAAELLDSNSLCMQTDTIIIPVYDNKGRMTAPGMNYHEYNAPVKTLYLNRGDYFRLAIRHLMPVDTLPGVADISLHLQR